MNKQNWPGDFNFTVILRKLARWLHHSSIFLAKKFCCMHLMKKHGAENLLLSDISWRNGKQRQSSVYEKSVVVSAYTIRCRYPAPSIFFSLLAYFRWLPSYWSTCPLKTCCKRTQSRDYSGGPTRMKRVGMTAHAAVQKFAYLLSEEEKGRPAATKALKTNSLASNKKKRHDLVINA